MTQLTNLDLDTNQLTGTLPVAWSSMTQLVELYLYSNQLTGTLPMAWSSMTQLDTLQLFSNQLTGTLPVAWSSMTQLTTLDLAKNQLMGTLPVEWSSMTQLMIISLDSNQLRGTLPANWSSMSQLNFLTLASNQLNGTLPKSWSTLKKLGTLVLNNNKLTGTIPVAWKNMTSLSTISLNDNQLTGDIPAFLLNLTALQQLDLSNNAFTGTPLAASFNAPSLQLLQLANNSFTGTLTPTFGTDAPMLVTLLLQDNKFSGSLPPSLGNMTQLKSFIGHHNKFDGLIPDGLGKASNITNLVLAGNRLNGSIPATLGSSKSLRLLVLRANLLSGNITSLKFASNPSLRVLDLSGNNIQGSMPSFSSNHSIQQISLSANRLGGKIPEQVMQLPKLEKFHIDRNFFSCELPELKEYNRTLSCRDSPMDWMDKDGDGCIIYAANDKYGCRSQGTTVGTNGLTANQACCTCGGGNRTFTKVKGLPSIKFPTDHAVNATNAYAMNMLSGNTFGCPIDESLKKRDFWGKVYECGWESITSDNKPTSPVGMTIISLFMIAVVLILRCCISASIDSSAETRAYDEAALHLAIRLSAGHRQHSIPPSPASDIPIPLVPHVDKTARLTVQNEATDLFLYISSTLKISVALGTVAALLALPAFLSAHSPIQCQYALKHTGAYKVHGFPTFMVEIAAFLFSLILIGWIAAQSIRQMKMKINKNQTSKENTNVNIKDIHFVLSCKLEDRSKDAINVEYSNGSETHSYSIDALPAHKKVYKGDIRLPFEPAAVLWGNATKHADVLDQTSETVEYHYNEMSSSGIRKACREASWKGFVTLIFCVIGCLIFGLVPNVLYVLVESGVIPLSSSSKSIATLFIVGMKNGANLIVAPAAAAMSAQALHPTSKFMHARIRTVLKVWLTFFNTLGWPMLAVIALSPICFRDWIVSPDPVEISYSYTQCVNAADPTNNAGGFKGCGVTGIVTNSANITQPFKWNSQCPSTILKIYGPIYILPFAYGIIASAVSLLMTSHAFKRCITWNEKRKRQKAAAANNVSEKKNKKCSCIDKMMNKKKKKKKKSPPPTLGVIDYYSDSALNVAVIASFGFFYPSVAVLGVIHMSLNAYATRIKINDMLDCQTGLKSANLLRTEGASGLPVSAVVAVVGVNAGLFFFVFGPFGMIKTTSIHIAAYIAPILALVGVVFSKCIAHQWQTRAARQLEKLTPLLNKPLMHRRSDDMSSSALDLNGEEKKEAGDDESGTNKVHEMLKRYAESFHEWSSLQNQSLHEVELEEELIGLGLGLGLDLVLEAVA